MLVLTRKKGESIVILDAKGDAIEIYVTKIDYDQVKIGIKAPMDFKVFRRELYDEMANP